MQMTKAVKNCRNEERIVMVIHGDGGTPALPTGPLLPRGPSPAADRPRQHSEPRFTD